MDNATYSLSGNDIDRAIDQYIETALWSELDDEGDPLDSVYSVEDIDPESRQRMAADVRAFIAGCEEFRPGVFDGIHAEQIGHDFWLTRNGHGAGFWDRGLGERGDWLTEMSHPYGEASLYVGDDSRLHYQG